jgi:hypothetical protein
LEFFRDGLPEKKLQLVGMSILLILLSPGLGCYNYCVPLGVGGRSRKSQ